MAIPHNIYIHVPFCASKCNYCAFYSAAITPDWEQYADNICNEIDDWGRRLGKTSVPTIFFGGGTPSLMPVDIFVRIMNKIRTAFTVVSGAEVTLESNPGTIDKARLREFIDAGVNRLSVGVQSLNDDALQFLGRRHSVRDARVLIDAAMSMGVRTSADFIYGLPDQTARDVEKICDDINSLGLTHCSMYELTIEPATPFGKMNLSMPTNDEMADMYNAIGARLSLPRYEVSNYAARGNECQHNVNVWDGAPYIGIGRGAAGRVYMDGIWYEQLGGGVQCTAISHRTRAIEKVITGMRTMRGVLLSDDVRDVLRMDWVDLHPELVNITNNRICATPAGLLTLDNILPELIG